MRFEEGKVTIFAIVLTGFCLGYAQLKSIADGNSAPTNNRHERANSRLVEDGEKSPNSFYPSFSHFDSPPLGHSRPFYFQNNNNNQEGAYSQRSQPFEQLFEGPEKFTGFAKEDYIPVPETPKSENILGSGNFGVITGGTFFNDADERSNNYGDFDSFYQNGHGRPSYYKQSSNHKPRYQQFANFKDFADINTPSIRQYSQKVNIYVNKGDSEVAESKEDAMSQETTSEISQDVKHDTKKGEHNLSDIDDMEHFSLKQLDTEDDDTISQITVKPSIKLSHNNTDNATRSDNGMEEIMTAFQHIFEILALLQQNQNHSLKQNSDGKYGLENPKSSQAVRYTETFMKNVKEDIEDGDGSDLFIEVLKVSSTERTPELDRRTNENKTDVSERSNSYPKNIIESLAILDSQPVEDIPEKKLSKSKRKLAALHPEKKHNAKLLKKEKLLKELSDPLLALS